MTRTTARVLAILWLLLTAAALSPLLWGLAEVEAAPDSPGLRPGRIAQLGANSVAMAGGAAALSVMLAVPTALAAMRLEGPRARRTMLACAALPLFVPPPVIAVAAIRLFGPAGAFTSLLVGHEAVFPVAEQIAAATPQIASAPIYTLAGGAFALAWVYHPIATFALCALLARADADAEESALLETSPLRVLGRVTLPLAGGGLAAGAFLAFLFALNDFGIPESLRSLPVLVSEVYVQAGVYFDMRAALGAGLAMFAIAAMLVVGAARFLPADVGLGESAPARRAFAMRGVGPLRALGWATATLPALMAVGILWHTATGPHGRVAVWRATWSTAHDELFFTVTLGTAVAAIVAVVGTLLGCALAAMRRPTPWRAATVLSLVVPGPLLGVGLQVLLRRPPGSLPLGFDDALAAISQTHAPLLFAWALRFAPVAALLVERALRAIPADHLDAARAEGAGAFALFRAVQWPAARRAVGAGALAAFALSLGEVGAAILLMPPGTTTLGVRLLTLMHYAPTGQVSALCLMVLAPGLAAWAVLVLGWRRRV